MPMYTYECEACAHRDEEFQFMADPLLTVCPKCKAQAYCKRPSLPHSDMIEFHKPIEMYSIGLTDDEEIKAFKRRCPDVHVETNPSSDMYGIPIARTRKQKLDALQAMNCVEVK